MIQITTINPDIIKMEIKMHIPQENIREFLQRKGYEIIAYKQTIPAKEEMLVSEPRLELYTFTATKQGEHQSDNNTYLKVFEKEFKCLLNEVTNS